MIVTNYAHNGSHIKIYIKSTCCIQIYKMLHVKKIKYVLMEKRGSRGSEIKFDFQEEIRNKFYQMSYIRVK